jgi:hypothetical protein
MALRSFILAAAVLISSPGYAAGWSGDLTVTSSFVEGTSDLIAVFTDGGSAYTSGCLANNWLITTTTDARRARVYATIMTALATGQKIRLWYTDTCATWSYHEATSVMLVKAP